MPGRQISLLGAATCELCKLPNARAGRGGPSAHTHAHTNSYVPTLLWFGASDAALRGHVALGVLGSLGLFVLPLSAFDSAGPFRLQRPICHSALTHVGWLLSITAALLGGGCVAWGGLFVCWLEYLSFFPALNLGFPWEVLLAETGADSTCACRPNMQVFHQLHRHRAWPLAPRLPGFVASPCTVANH